MKILEVEQRTGYGSDEKRDHAYGMLTVPWCEDKKDINYGNPNYYELQLACIERAAFKVMNDVVRNAPRNAISGTVGVFEHNRTFRNATTYWSAIYNIYYFTELAEGEIDLRRGYYCRECFADHLALHEKTCSLRGEDRLIYVGSDNLSTELSPHHEVLVAIDDFMPDYVPIPEIMAPDLFRRMRAYKEACIPEGYWKRELEKERRKNKNVPEAVT